MDTQVCSCEDLSEYFDAERRPSNFASIIDNPIGSFRCEMQRVSARSQGCPVLDEEILIRVVVAPRGVCGGDVFKLSDYCILDISGIGLSVLRVTGEDSISGEIERLARFLVDRAADATPEGEHAECVGVVEFTASQLRSHRSKEIDARVFGAYESPEVDYPSHSDALQAVGLYPSGRKAKLAARDFLDTIRGQFHAAADYTRANIRGLTAAGRRKSPEEG